MSGSVNKVLLVGLLGADPEVRNTKDGKMVCNLRLATTESWRDKNTGELKSQSEWHRITIFNEGLARVAEQYLRKGSSVYIEGQLRTRKWTNQQGQDQYSTEVVLQGFDAKMVMLGSPNGNGVPAQQHGPQQSQQQTMPPYRASNTIQHSGPSLAYSGAGGGGSATHRQLPPEPVQDEIVW